MRQITDGPDARVNQVRTRAALFLVIAVAAGGGAVLLLRQYMLNVQSAALNAAPQTRPVVVAAMDIPIATRLEEKHLTVIQWPAAHAPIGAYPQLSALLSKSVRQNIVKGEALLKDRIADESSGQGLASLLSAGMRAMAVEVDALVGVAGFVQPGDYVDVVTTMQPDDETHRQRADDAARVSKIILQNVRVLAVGEHLTTTEVGKPVNAHVYTLAVTPRQSETLALASQYGKLQLSLRSRIDQGEAETEGQTPAKLLVGTAPAPRPAKAEEPKPRSEERRPRQPQPTAAAAPLAEPKPQASPGVEILRGNRVEERKLHTGSAQ